MLRVVGPPVTAWDALLPEQARRLPEELARIDGYLDDERFIAPWRVLFDARLGRPSVPVATLLRLLYLKHRYQLGYESLCAEVADSIGWRRFAGSRWTSPCPTRPPWSSSCAAPGRSHRAAQHRAGRQAGWWASWLPASCCGPASCASTPPSSRPTVVEADIDHPTDADLLEHAVRKLGGLVRRIKARGAATRT